VAGDWIEANGVGLHYALGGEGERTVVLVPEMGGGVVGWEEVAQELQADFRVLRYDPRGFGLSEKKADLTLANAVEDLAALLDALDITGPVCLAGAALGATVCLAFALKHPQRVQSLVLSSPATGGLTPVALQAMEARLALVAQGGLRAVTDAMLAITYPPALRADVQRFERQRLRWLTMPADSFIALNRMLADVDLLPQLPAVAQPALVIGCSLDSVRPAVRSAELAALMQNARFVEAQSGHFMPVQTPALFAALLRDFVNETARTA
jgi:3-oxoadipate enol-lactonase